MGEREKREDLEREQRADRDRNIDTYLCLLFSFLKALSSRLDSAVKRCSIELCGLVKGLA